jgi:prolyl oligopeptidase
MPARAKLVKRLTELYQYERRGVLGKVNGVLFFIAQSGLQPQPCIFKQAAADPKPVVLIDPNSLSKDGTVAVSGFSPTDDARLVAYATSDGGSDWMTWHVRDVATQQDTPDKLVWCKFSGAAWTHDDAGFFYCRYPAPKQGDELERGQPRPQALLPQARRPQEKDALVYERPDQPEWLLSPSVTDDGRYLVIGVSSAPTGATASTSQADCAPDGGSSALLDDFDASYDLLGNQGRRLLLPHRPRRAAQPRDRDRRTKPDRANWSEVVATSADQLTASSLVNRSSCSTTCTTRARTCRS